MFIIWLKFGSHRVGILSKIYRFLGLWVNTTVDVKTKFFPEFMERLKNFAFVCPVCTDKTTAAFLLTFLLRQLRNPCNRTEANLFAIYRLVERLWKTDGHDQVVEHDTDTGKSKESK
jgi:hypothetical protein